jgi:hypothetical protein
LFFKPSDDTRELSNRRDDEMVTRIHPTCCAFVSSHNKSHATPEPPRGREF